MNFLNSPPGPLGAAGQSSKSTQPTNLFSNASSPFSRLGSGVQSFRDRIGNFGGGNSRDSILSALFGNLFGGDGGLLGGFRHAADSLGKLPQNVGNGLGQAMSGAASIFGGGQGANPTGGGLPGTAGKTTGGFLSRFMQGNQNG